MLNILLIVDVVSKIISLVIFVCLAMYVNIGSKILFSIIHRLFFHSIRNNKFINMHFFLFVCLYVIVINILIAIRKCMNMKSFLLVR